MSAPSVNIAEAVKVYLANLATVPGSIINGYTVERVYDAPRNPSQIVNGHITVSAATRTMQYAARGPVPPLFEYEYGIDVAIHKAFNAAPTTALIDGMIDVVEQLADVLKGHEFAGCTVMAIDGEALYDMVIIEAMIDYGADRLEELRNEALTISQRIFHKDMTELQKRKVSQINAMLRDTLVQIGDMGERLSHIRDTQLVLQRAMPFVIEHGDGWMEPAVKARLKMAASDVQSLNDYEVHLTDKLQFLLDADLGFINNEQNDLFKVMTVWSVAGIPPVLFAGIWGMNFHFMPELSWEWGYPLALGTILLSLILPLMWFRHRGWW